MYEYYKINDEEWREIANQVTNLDLINMLPEFDVNYTNLESAMNSNFTVLNLMYYVDKHGDWNERQHSKHGKVAKAVFNSMPNNQKAEMINYFSILEEQKENDLFKSKNKRIHKR